MPRKSAAALNVVPLGKGRAVLKPMNTLKPAEQVVFDLIVRNHVHLGQLDIPLLTAYAIASAKLATKMKVAELDKTVRLMMTLATKLRLTPQSRIDPDKLSRRHQSLGVNNKYPWVDDEAEGDQEEESGGEDKDE